MKSSYFELFCVILLGLGQMFLMTGWDLQLFIVEPVLHSFSMRHPSTISEYAGYYGQAVWNASFMVSCLFLPALLTIVSSKWMLFLSALCFTLYQAGFLYINNYLYYALCVLIGFGVAAYYIATGAYLASHSSRRTIEKNTALSWALSCICMVLGGALLFFILGLGSKDKSDEVFDNNNTTSKTRSFSDSEIKYTFGAFVAVTVLADILFVILPERDVEDCIERTKEERRKSLTQRIGITLKGFVNKRVLLLTPLFFFSGLFGAFWSTVYTTSLLFTHSFDSYYFLAAYYSLAVGSGEVLMGGFVAVMSKKIRNFGMKPTMYIGSFLCILALAAITASAPKSSTYRQTDEDPWLIQPSLPLALTIGFVLGAADACANSVKGVMCTLALNVGRSDVFAISRFYQGSFTAVMMFLSPYMSIYAYTILLAVSLAISLFTFLKVTSQILRSEKTVQPEIQTRWELKEDADKP